MKRREFVDYQFSSEVLTKPTPMKDNNNTHARGMSIRVINLFGAIRNCQISDTKI